MIPGANGAAPRTILTDFIPTPIGDVLLASDGVHVLALYFEQYRENFNAHLRRHYPSADIVCERNPGGASALLAAYFDSDLAALDQVPVSMSGTPFQKNVWNALREIRPGTTASYGQIAAMLGSPTATRAVGAANGANPVSIIVPCHRVIGASGALTGYGGGMSRKQWLLAHEGYTLL